MRSVGSEEDLAFMLSRYIRINYPNVVAHFDFGSGTKLTIGQARKQKRLNARAYPDLFIAKPVHVAGVGTYCGMFLEIKRAGTRLTRRDGEWASEHLSEQAAVLDDLRDAGYVAQFGVGFDDCQELIDSYLAGYTLVGEQGDF